VSGPLNRASPTQSNGEPSGRRSMLESIRVFCGSAEWGNSVTQSECSIIWFARAVENWFGETTGGASFSARRFWWMGQLAVYARYPCGAFLGGRRGDRLIRFRSALRRDRFSKRGFPSFREALTRGSKGTGRALAGTPAFQAARIFRPPACAPAEDGGSSLVAEWEGFGVCGCRWKGSR